MKNKLKTKIISAIFVVALATGGMIYSVPAHQTTAAVSGELTASPEPTIELTAKPTENPAPEPTKKPQKIEYQYQWPPSYNVKP